MIWTDKEFTEEAKVFWRKECQYLNEKPHFNLESTAYTYVRNNQNFKYKDKVEADVLVQCLVDLGYIEFAKKENNARYHSLTEKGVSYINDRK